MGDRVLDAALAVDADLPKRVGGCVAVFGDDTDFGTECASGTCGIIGHVVEGRRKLEWFGGSGGRLFVVAIGCRTGEKRGPL